jgi:hypothetical protein
MNARCITRVDPSRRTEQPPGGDRKVALVEPHRVVGSDRQLAPESCLVLDDQVLYDEVNEEDG